ncbi:MAG: cytochrome c [Hyphomicrobiaceae bacterium]|nr:cytochrome c [Hyphomicrobiaceae bacterium]
MFALRCAVATIALALAGALDLSDAAEAGGDATAVAQGRKILAESCERCHAIGKTGDSPLANAPPFRALHRKYPVGHLAEALAEGITTGHDAMPEFIFSTDEIVAILAYLDSIADGALPPR